MEKITYYVYEAKSECSLKFEIVSLKTGYNVYFYYNGHDEDPYLEIFNNGFESNIYGNAKVYGNEE